MISESERSAEPSAKHTHVVSDQRGGPRVVEYYSFTAPANDSERPIVREMTA